MPTRQLSSIKAFISRRNGPTHNFEETRITIATTSTLELMKKRRLRRFTLFFACFCLVSLALLGTVGRSWVEELLAEPAPTSPPVPLDIELSAQEQSFYNAVVPRMLVVVAEASTLAEMGRAHSRNILELQARGDRVKENASQIEKYAIEHGVPARFQSAYAQFSDGVELLDQAMNDSRQGMLTLDWDKVAASLGVFEAGAETVSSATEKIQNSTAEATPTNK
jgi:hypothetical protein